MDIDNTDIKEQVNNIDLKKLYSYAFVWAVEIKHLIRIGYSFTEASNIAHKRTADPKWKEQILKDRDKYIHYITE